nr:hypothetical protein [Dendronalium sp. ChiSLP03b]MDZ8203940.1 hypothetical protein [Dendronalium sp. ChiSLP03b]
MSRKRASHNHKDLLHSLGYGLANTCIYENGDRNSRLTSPGICQKTAIYLIGINFALSASNYPVEIKKSLAKG